MKPDFTQFDAALDEDDHEWMLLNASRHLAAIEKLILTGATPQAIRQYAQRRISTDRSAFVLRCEGAARHLASQRVNG